jgi:hypothetical protein
MADRNGYIGRAPSDSSVVVARQVFSPAGVTTDFTFTSGYSVGYLDAYLNGARLIEGQDYNATDGSAISLVSAATNGDVLELVAYKAFNVATATVGIYSGGDPISTQVNTLNFIGAGNTFALRGSTVDISIAGGGGGGVGFATDAVGLHTSSAVGINTNSARTGLALYVVGNQENTGILTAATLSATTGSFSGNVSIAGTLTYEDVTNVDSVGLVTARSGVRITAGGLVVTSGVTTLTDNTFVGSGVSIYSATGIVSATAFYGSGANLTGLPAGGVEIQSAGSPLGAGVTIINFQSGATVTASGAGSTITISAGIQTAAASGGAVTLNLSSAQDHKVTATGITTITVSGGTEGESHTVRIVNSGIATVGFSTYFLFPSGSVPSLPTADGTINLISFTVHRVGAAGTQLLAGAGLNYQ